MARPLEVSKVLEAVRLRQRSALHYPQSPNSVRKSSYQPAQPFRGCQSLHISEHPAGSFVNGISAVNEAAQTIDTEVLLYRIGPVKTLGFDVEPRPLAT